MFQLAVYGKGGIGKSTLSANISVALAKCGMKVMQIGCDPKHDSTRLLLGGRTQRTILDYVREVPIAQRKIEDVIETGTEGVMCAEAGGPEPGIGCAGRGILTAFDTLRRLGADDIETDVRIYDVLGDVVCGGFAVPLRNEYADAVLIVTSGEFMSMYAANNIMRGLSNFDAGKPRLLGIVLNSRGVEGESEVVNRFAKAAGTEIIAEIPRDSLFADAEARGHTVTELNPNSVVAERIRIVAERIRKANAGECGMVTPTPLDDDQMSDLAAGREIRPGSGKVPRTSCNCRKSIAETRIMSSCAAYGAMAAACRMEDAAVIIHGPMSCAYLMETTRLKALIGLYSKGVLETHTSGTYGKVRCTNMDESASIFGGKSFLEKAISEAIDDGYRKIAVVTTCMPGIIGDDCDEIVRGFRERYPDIVFILIPADGDIAGEYSDGFVMAAEEISKLIDTSVTPEPGLVNIVATSFFDLQTHSHAKALDEMLSAFGLKINCRFLDDGSPERVENFCKACTDILLTDNRNAREMMDIVTRRTGRRPFPAALPVGFRDYVTWISAMGKFVNREDLARAEIERAEKEYRALVEKHRPVMEGRKIIVTWKMGGNPDWLLDTLNDLGTDVVRVGFSADSRKKRGHPDSRYNVTEDYTDDMLKMDFERFKPDLLIGDIVRPTPPGTAFARLSKIGVGYRAVFEYVEYLENTIRLPSLEGWRVS